jgi:hypothetical protein
LTSKMAPADRTQFYNAHTEKLANILIAQGDNFPKKPLRKLTTPFTTLLHSALWPGLRLGLD